MPEQFSDADCLALVERSPAAVAAHDKRAWLDLFASDYIVEDPVGSAPHIPGTGGEHGVREPLDRFYETFIAPNAIRFLVERDCPRDLEVMRDLTIEITMSPRVVVRVPVHLLYELGVEAGALKIRRLAAHWELRPMLQQQMAAGWPALRVLGASSVRMLRHLGVSGTAGLMHALSGVGAGGKARVERFVQAFNAGDREGLLAQTAAPGIEIAFSREAPPLCVAGLASLGGEIHVSKVLAAGNVVTATVTHDRAGTRRRGVALFRLDSGSQCITAMTCYWADT